MAARHVEGSAFERDVRRSASVQRGKGKGNPYVANAASAKGKGNHTWRELRPRATIEEQRHWRRELPRFARTASCVERPAEG